MATLVTGGTGFVGSNIVKTLAQRGHEVVCFDLVAPDPMVRKYLQPWAERITFVTGDILKRDDLERVAQDHDINKIVHAAVFTATRREIEAERSRSVVDINVVGTSNLLDVACGLSLQRFLYVSSGSVYGENRPPGDALHEDVILYPRSLYAATKYTSELLTRRYGELHGFPTVSVRLSSPYGPMERITGHRVLMSVPHQWTGNVVRGEPLRVGDRHTGRDYMYVGDTTAGICSVLDAPSLSHEAYNISPGRLTTLGEIIRALQEVRPSVQVLDEPSASFELLPPGVAPRILDGNRIKEELAFMPSFDLAAGMRDYLQWREENSYRD